MIVKTCKSVIVRWEVQQTIAAKKVYNEGRGREEIPLSTSIFG